MAGLPLVCPVCSAVWPFEAGVQNAEARTALAASVALWPAPLQAHALVYIGLFAPLKNKLNWGSVARVVPEYADLVQSGQVTRHRETRPAPLTSWADGLA